MYLTGQIEDGAAAIFEQQLYCACGVTLSLLLELMSDDTALEQETSAAEDEEQGRDHEQEGGIGVSAWYLSNGSSHNCHGATIKADPEGSNESARTTAFRAQTGHGGHGGAGCVDSSSDCGEDEEAQFEEDTDSFMLRRRKFHFPGLQSGTSPLARAQDADIRCSHTFVSLDNSPALVDWS